MHVRNVLLRIIVLRTVRNLLNWKSFFIYVAFCFNLKNSRIVKQDNIPL